jgi:starch synthase
LRKVICQEKVMAKKPPRNETPANQGGQASGAAESRETAPGSSPLSDSKPPERKVTESAAESGRAGETKPPAASGAAASSGKGQETPSGETALGTPAGAKPAPAAPSEQAPAATAGPAPKAAPARPVPSEPQPTVSKPVAARPEVSPAEKQPPAPVAPSPATAGGPAAPAPAESPPARGAPAPSAAQAPVATETKEEERPGEAEVTRAPTGRQPAIAPPAEEEGPVRAPAVEVEAEQPEAHQAAAPVPTEEPPPPVHHQPSIFIVHITPEMAPVAKVGGLADVVFGLTRELAIRGNYVEVILPKYNNMRYDHIWGLTPVFNDLWVPWYEGAVHCTVYFGFVHERKCFFIEPHSQDNFFNRDSIYGFNDDVLRYAFFARAAVEFLWKAGKHPDIIHCHDWQTALVPVYLYEIYQHLGMTHPRVCLTIHNFKHQGVIGGELLRATGLHHPERFFDYHRLRDNHNAHALNILKGGIVYSNFVSTVSPHYAFETKDQGQGFGLEPTLHTHHMKYGGVVNGIDYDVWNPEVDTHIPVHYSIESIEGKYDNKRALRHRLMLADNEKPIVAFIGRLDPQKGLDLVRHAIFYSLERGAQLVLLGSSPDQGINADFWGLKRMLNDSPDCHLEIGFDEDLAHLIYAGADMMLVPSRFEPCGLTQLIAMRYGTIPIVRSIGGLADTVFDKDHSHRALHERNGYVFENYDPLGLESALGRAIACYFNHPEHFRELLKNAMRYDYSWNIPGQDYLNIYHYVRNK